MKPLTIIIIAFSVLLASVFIMTMLYTLHRKMTKSEPTIKKLTNSSKNRSRKHTIPISTYVPEKTTPSTKQHTHQEERGDWEIVLKRDDDMQAWEVPVKDYNNNMYSFMLDTGVSTAGVIPEHFALNTKYPTRDIQVVSTSNGSKITCPYYDTCNGGGISLLAKNNRFVTLRQNDFSFLGPAHDKNFNYTQGMLGIGLLSGVTTTIRKDTLTIKPGTCLKNVCPRQTTNIQGKKLTLFSDSNNSNMYFLKVQGNTPNVQCSALVDTGCNSALYMSDKTADALGIQYSFPQTNTPEKLQSTHAECKKIVLKSSINDNEDIELHDISVTVAKNYSPDSSVGQGTILVGRQILGPKVEMTLCGHKHGELRTYE